MASTTVARADATQRPFPPDAGFVQAVPKIDPITCRDCQRTLPPATSVCPICGMERGHAGAPYPSKEVERYDWVFEQDIGSVSQRIVLLALAAHDKPHGKGVFPSYERLARMTGLTTRGVGIALKALRSDGWIERRKVRRRGRQGSNDYTIQQPELIVAEHLQKELSSSRQKELSSY